MIVVHTVLLNWLWWFLPHRLWSQKLCESPTNFKPRKKKSRRIQRRSKSTRHYHIWFPMLLRSVLWISFVTKTLHIFRNISLRLIVDLYSPVILMDDVSWFSLIWFVKRSLLLHLCISISAQVSSHCSHQHSFKKVLVTSACWCCLLSPSWRKFFTGILHLSEVFPFLVVCQCPTLRLIFKINMWIKYDYIL